MVSVSCAFRLWALLLEDSNVSRFEEICCLTVLHAIFDSISINQAVFSYSGPRIGRSRYPNKREA